MRKIYSLLLLGGLLLLGAQSAWATDYFIAHNGKLTSGGWQIHQKPMVEKDGIYSINFNNVGTDEVWFRIVKAKDDWETIANYSQNDADHGNITMSNTPSGGGANNDNNLIFTLASASSITIYYNPSGSDNKKIYASTIGNYDVEIHLEGTNSKLHAFDNFANVFTTAAYPGDLPVAGGEGTSAKPYVWSLSVPQGTELSVIFSSTDDANHTLDLYSGVVSADNMVFNYELTAYNPWVLKGTFDDWISHASNGNQISLTFEASKTYYFGIHATDKDWYVNDVANNPITSNACTDWGLHKNGGENIPIQTTIAGEYTFIWDDANKKVSVIYPVQLSADGYASLFLPVEVVIPDGVNAYYQSSHTAVGTAVTVNFTKITGTVIPANTPVILKGTANATHGFTYSTTSASTPSIDLFKGVTTETAHGSLSKTAADDYIYVLAGTGASFGFHQLNSTSGVVKASRCYLDIPKANGPAQAPAISLWLEDENGATAIEFFNEEESVKDNAIYTILGQRVNNMSAPGIYIQNGKKFIVK